MPAEYLAMKRKFKKKGMKDDDAKTKAAKIFNSKNPNNPVGPNYEEEIAKKKKGKKRGKKRPVNFKQPGY